MDQTNKAVLRSVALFDSGYGCAESVLLAIAEERGIRSELIPRIASGFCGGLANTGGMCGAVTGAIIAINMILGRDRQDQSKAANYAAVQAFMKAFIARFGSVTCPALTGVNLGTESGQAEFAGRNLHPVCAGYVAEAVRIGLGVVG